MDRSSAVLHAAPDSVSGPDTLALRWTASAARFADRVAVRADGVEITYRELDRRARALAANLARHGLAPGDLCGLYLERSIDCVASILAVTLAGAAWLPLDPGYPAARLRKMAEDAGIRHLIGHEETDPLGLDPAPRMHAPEPDNSASLPRAANDAAGSADPGDLAYVIYTSGSTGRPKGIQIEHRGLIAFLDSMQALLDPAALRHVLSVSSPSFDISLLDLFLPFACGGTVTLATRTEARDGRLLAARLDAERPSLLQATPATWRMLLAAGWQGHDGLTLLTGAEAIAPAMARDLMDRSDALWNLYGPTETTVWATAARLTKADVDSGIIPIGRPLAHIETRIVDEDLQPVADGDTGELCLLGPSLSRGYIGEPALTAERFVDLPGGRAYRTGDRASLRPDGQLAFHGRVDHQIKLNSFRIEPAEIETVLRGHAGVRDAVVAAKPVGDGDPRLVAYVVPEDFDPDQRRRQRLSDHWRSIWTREYDEIRDDLDDPTFNTAGLRSSYDGQPIADAALRENVERTVERIRALEPKRILDLGCGSGLLLFPLARQCECYVGVDFSSEAIDDLERETARLDLRNVALLEQAVDDPTGIDAGGFDVVLLNTVIQYFPDVGYLEAVLDNALRALRPGGVVFVGDVRELGALDAFHASIVQAKATGHEDLYGLRQELRRVAGRETELVFDPAWFDAFAASRPEITAVQIAQKHGRNANELADYRYDLILRKGGTPQPMEPALNHDAADSPDLAEFWRRLDNGAAQTALITTLLNARRRDAVAFLQSLGTDPHLSNTGGPDLTQGVLAEPNDIVETAGRHGYQAVLLPDPAGSPAHFAALLVRDEPGATLWSHRPPAEATRQPPTQLSNELQQSLAAPSLDHAGLIEALQSRAVAELPGAMCPAHYVVLKEMPLTPSRKVDRNALPVPANGRPDLGETFVAPRDALELRLAGIVGETLGVSPVGVRDSVFDLGGDSLSTVELLLAVEDGFGVAVELGRFLDQPTVEGLAEAVNEGRDFRPSTALVTLKAGGTEPPLFFIHGAGGLAFTVFELGQALPGDRPIYAVQDPACDPGVEPARDVEAMAAALIEQIMTVQPRGPYHICGHSFGGLLAYEMAIQLRAQGHAIAFLGMLDTPTPPAAMKGHGAAARLLLAWRELRFLAQILTQAGPMAMDGCYVLFGAEARYRNSGDREGAKSSLPEMLRGAWANVLFRYFHKRAGLASAVERNSRLLMLRQPGIRRSIRLTGIHDSARRRYRPGRYDGAVTLFRAETASAETQGFPDDTLGWNRLARRIVIHRAPGSHFTMTRGANVPPLARVLSQALEGA